MSQRQWNEILGPAWDTKPISDWVSLGTLYTEHTAATTYNYYRRWDPVYVLYCSIQSPIFAPYPNFGVVGQPPDPTWMDIEKAQVAYIHVFHFGIQTAVKVIPDTAGSGANGTTADPEAWAINRSTYGYHNNGHTLENGVFYPTNHKKWRTDSTYEPVTVGAPIRRSGGTPPLPEWPVVHGNNVHTIHADAFQSVGWTTTGGGGYGTPDSTLCTSVGYPTDIGVWTANEYNGAHDQFYAVNTVSDPDNDLHPGYVEDPLQPMTQYGGRYEILGLQYFAAKWVKENYPESSVDGWWADKLVDWDYDFYAHEKEWWRCIPTNITDYNITWQLLTRSTTNGGVGIALKRPEEGGNSHIWASPDTHWPPLGTGTSGTLVESDFRWTQGESIFPRAQGDWDVNTFVTDKKWFDGVTINPPAPTNGGQYIRGGSWTFNLWLNVTPPPFRLLQLVPGTAALRLRERDDELGKGIGGARMDKGAVPNASITLQGRNNRIFNAGQTYA